MAGDTVNTGTAKKVTKGKKKWIADEWEILISKWAENECLFNTSSLGHTSSSDFKLRHKVTTFQSLRRILAAKWNPNRSSIAGKSQENRKCKRVFIVTLFEFDTLPHKDALCKCVTVVDGRTRCLGACYMSRICYRFTHRNLFQITNLGRGCPQCSTRTKRRDEYRKALSQITNFCFVVSQITISRFWCLF